ncbi:ArsR/SmtB family transcription factor [Haloferax volcanii]|uniref:ArsR family transcription regulator n=3 Tax=Haloferax volcanii TaxID=2246 RepID=D4GXJ8_HALVD|nr:MULTISPECIES: winged helix-turn-helix domain-containing protein [Haloferax]ADE04952.1 ArsR family transcription regulator [Haloferax volcanii DS2]ELY27982.1 ArsR family domain-containing transcriptional regulator [Haloferax volcanii DS2]MBS8117769.1 helix-turn-helix transcriptional regulator [Haloferax volcanii]MBS8122781.1 helix-turn-helix transcriptional regulator [Haloferax volcanii]MBS8126649.1 helix-turn-helix transcriptional regulator [Haloferax volcanii]
MATNDPVDSDGLPEDPAELLPPTSVLTLDEYLDMQAALGDRTRFTLLYRLVHFGERSPKALAEALDVQANTLHYHLNKLVDAGLVEKRKRSQADDEGLFSYYRATSLGSDILEHGVEELIRRERDYRNAYASE